MSNDRAAARNGLRAPIAWETEPKAAGGLRRIARLAPADDLGYARAVSRVAANVEHARHPASIAGRVAGWDPRNGLVLQPWRGPRRRWHRDIAGWSARAAVAVTTDVRECYASIGPGVVRARLRSLGVHSEAVDEVERWLRRLANAGVAGLPVGPAASAVLAEAVLLGGDDALRRTGVAYRRWVDDVWIFAADRRSALRALDALRAAWTAAGLTAHEGKTAILADRAAAVARAGGWPGSPGPGARWHNPPT